MRKLHLLGLAGVVGLCVAANACSSDPPKGGAEDDDESSGGSGGSQGTAGSGTGNAGVGGFNPMGSGGSTGTAGNCNSPPGSDDDLDGFTEMDGDCNDCDKNVNPGALEVYVDPGMGGAGGAGAEPADEDCDGTIDNVLPTCDMGLAVDDGDPNSAAKAIDICQDVATNNMGLVSSAWVRADGTPAGPAQALGYGIFDNFGPNVNVQGGERMLGVSSGYARLPGQPGACTSWSCSTSFGGIPPAGFPAVVPNCAGGTNINDDVALEVKLRAPTNATGYRFLFKFYSFEFAEYVCTNFNDQFITLVTPPPMGAQNGNIVFDSMNNPVSVNIAFFDVCDPVQNNDFAIYCFGGMCPAQPNPYCPSGGAELQGNGFDNAFGSNGEDAGATSWLQTTAPIGPAEEFTMRFAIWDTGDSAWDSTTLIDGFEWIATGGTPGVGTEPIPDPK